MKIIYFLQSTFNAGGMERIVISKANLLSQLGHNVFIVTNAQHGFQPFFPIDDKIECIDLNINYDEIQDIPILKKIPKYLYKQKLHKVRLQKIVSEINPDILISTYGYEVGFLHKIKTRAKKIAEIHFSKQFRTYRNRNGLWKLANKWLSYKSSSAMRKYDAFICLTNEDSHRWNYKDNLHIIPNFIEKISVKPAKLDSKEVIAVGRLNYQKGFDRLLEIWKQVHEKYPDWSLKILGNGELKETLNIIIEASGLTNSVRIMDPVKDIYKELQKASIYVMTSRYEGLPMVLIEAMACGLPIISFACPCGPKDLLENSGAGFLIKENDYNDFADKLGLLIEDIDQRKKMGEASYHHAQNFKSDVIIKKWVTLFNEILENNQ